MKKIKTAFFFVLLYSNIRISAQTCTIAISNAVTNPTPMPFGLNWQEENSNLSLNAFNNHTGDPGMGRQIIRLKDTLDGGGTNYAIHATGHKFDADSSLYTGMFNGGNIRIYRETPTGIIKIRDETIISFLADAVNGYSVTFANGTSVQARDIFIISNETTQELGQYCHPRLTSIRNGSSNTWAKLSSGGNALAVTKQLDAIDKPLNGGTTSCKIVNTDPPNLNVGIGQVLSNSIKSGQFSFDPSKTYRFSVWLKQSGISGGLVTLHTSTTNITTTFTVTNSWQQYTYDVTNINPVPSGGTVDYLSLTFNGTGTLWVDNFLMYDVAYPPFALLPNIQQELMGYKPYDVRIWSGHINNAELGTNIDDWTDTELQSAKLWDLSTGPVSGSSLKLPTALPIFESNNIVPYLICNPSFSENDFLGLMEYLGGPSTSPYGIKRTAQGHPLPYTSSFSKIFIELGNETWNPIFFPWNFNLNGGVLNGSLYGKYIQYFYNIIKSSPYYDPSKFELLVGGFYPQPEQTGYGNSAIKMAPDGKQVMIAHYIGGADGLNIPSSPTFADSIQQTTFYSRWITRNIIDLHVRNRDQMAIVGYPYKLSTYEAGPDYKNPNYLNPYDIHEERIGKSLGCAVANLDAFLYQSQKGFELQNLFAFNRGYNWASHTPEPEGLRPHTFFLALKMRNNYVKGTMITSSVSNSPTTLMPFVDSPSGPYFNGIYDTISGEAPGGNFENIAAYSFKDSNNYSVFVLNRNISTNTPVLLQLPVTSTHDSVFLYSLSGDPSLNNINSTVFSIQKQDISALFSGTTYNFTMPKGSIYLFRITKNSAAGINEIQKNSDFVKVFPNPSSGIFSVVFENSISLKPEIEIYNNVGEKIAHKRIYSDKTEINLSREAKGVYFYKVFSESKFIAGGKLVIQ